MREAGKTKKKKRIMGLKIIARMISHNSSEQLTLKDGILQSGNYGINIKLETLFCSLLSKETMSGMKRRLVATLNRCYLGCPLRLFLSPKKPADNGP